MKKTAILALALALVMGTFTACGGAKDGDGKDTASYTVGICNYVDDASLNQIVENLENRLHEIAEEKGETLEIKYQNCNADSNVLNQIISDFTAAGVDLMIGVATPVAMAMQSATEDNEIPVVFAAVSDPVSAGLVDSLEAPGHNITGTSDYLNTTAVMNLMLAQNPELTKVGLLYDIGQDSSKTPIEEAKKFLDEHNIEYTEKNGITVSDLQQAADELIAAGVDAIFTPTDNSVMTAELSIYEAMRDAGIPHYAGADSFALNGAFLGYGVDYANLGEKTAEMAAQILFDGASPKTLSVMTFDNGTATVNTEICEALGYDLDALKEAFAPFCTKIQTIQTAESFDN